jgi:hypothetical protein
MGERGASETIFSPQRRKGCEEIAVRISQGVYLCTVSSKSDLSQVLHRDTDSKGRYKMPVFFLSGRIGKKDINYGRLKPGGKDENCIVGYSTGFHEYVFSKI